MPSWQAEYLAALNARDEREKANYDLIESCTGDSVLCLVINQKAKLICASYHIDAKLADRTARLAETQRHPPTPAAAPGPPPKSPRPGSARKVTDSSDRAGTPTPSTDEAITQLKSSLSEAQRSKAEMQARLKACTEELEKLKSKYHQTWTRAQELSSEQTALASRLRDKEGELRGKAKLLEVSGCIDIRRHDGKLIPDV